MIKLNSLIIGLFLFATSFGQTKIDGYVHDLNTLAPLYNTRITLSILDTIKFNPDGFDSLSFQIFNTDTRYDTVYKKIKTVRTDSNGYYFFDGLLPNTYKLSAFHRTKEVKPGYFEGESYDTSGIRIKGDCNITRSFKLHVTCEYDSTKDLKQCPICKKSDKVLLIRYGRGR